MNRNDGNGRRAQRPTRGRGDVLSLLADKPFPHTRNPFAPLEPLTAEQIEAIHNASMTILEEIGVDFLDGEALDLWAAAGARVERSTSHVYIDRGLLMALLATVPAQFTLRARDPARNLTVGGSHINFATVGGAPFYSDLESGRRPGPLADFRRMVQLAHLCGPIHIVEGLLVEPQDLPVPVRHLDKALAQFTLSDKAMTAAAHGREVAADYIAMAAIVYGGLEGV